MGSFNEFAKLVKFIDSYRDMEGGRDVFLKKTGLIFLVFVSLGIEVYPKVRMNYLIRRFGDIFIIWLEDYNQWIQLEKPAFFVFERIALGLDLDSIIRDFIREYGTGNEEAYLFAREIKSVIDSLSEKKTIRDEKITKSCFCDELKSMKKQESAESRNEFCHWYQANGKIIKVNYCNELNEYYLHHSISHLGIPYSAIRNAEFLMGENEICQSFPMLKSWKEEDIPGLKRRFFIEFGNILYDRDDESWMGIIHGAALKRGQQGFILCSATGAGKSTLALMLQKEGYTIASDDYIALEAGSSMVYPFPAAVSVKKGSYELLSQDYPELMLAPERKFRLTNKSLRFLPPDNSRDFDYHPFPVKCIFYINYNPDSGNILKELAVPQAFQLFNKEAWISGKKSYAEGLIDWFSGLEHYSLEYSRGREIIQKIDAVF